jgi:hypothetical protein
MSEGVLNEGFNRSPNGHPWRGDDSGVMGFELSEVRAERLQACFECLECRRNVAFDSLRGEFSGEP